MALSEAAQLRKEGQELLRSVDGETLTFRGAALVAVVDRGLAARDQDKGQVDFTGLDKSCIEFDTSSLTPPPEAQEQFTDEFEKKHRIQYVLRTDHTYKCFCVMTDEDE